MKFEWVYITILIISLIIALTTSLFIDIHTIFLFLGIIFTASAFIVVPKMTGENVELTALDIPNFFLQFGWGNIAIAAPAFVLWLREIALRPLMAVPAIPVLLVGVVAEEAYRIGSYKYFALTGSNSLAAFLSAIVFAAMHMWWFPADWIFAIIGGLALSGIMVTYQSQIAAVAVHFFFDTMSFQYVPVYVYIAVTVALLLVGYLLRRQR